MKTETRQCIKCKENFEIDENDFSFYEKMKVPAPHICPECRFKMKAVWRNEMSLYTGRKCGMCDKNIMSVYNSKSPHIVYCYDCFYSEKWDSKDYAQKFDTSRPFFEQFNELLLKVPKISLSNTQSVNSEYVNLSTNCKNCYLVFNIFNAEEIMYSRGVKDVKDSCDMYFGTEFDRCYEGVNIQQSSGVAWGKSVVGCVDCYFLSSCSGLTSCFGCVNLRNKSNCWFNEQLSKEEYKERLKEVLGSYEKMEEARKKFEEFRLGFPHRQNSNIKVVDSTGDYLFECKSVKDAFEVSGAEDCRYVFSSKMIKDSLGVIGFGAKCERLLESVSTGYSSNVIGSFWPDNCSNIMYSFFPNNCQDCIGCVNLKNSKNCILNYEYTKEEYEKLKVHIIEELTDKGLHGLMMPPELAPFAYNECVARDNFPMTKEEVLKAGFRWEDDMQITKGKETLSPEQIPDNIKDVPDSITSEVLKCIACERNYKITAQELLFYKKMNLPIPRKCFYCRHQDRIVRRGPYKFWDRQCAFCNKAISTNYAPERKEIIYCEECYQKEVI